MRKKCDPKKKAHIKYTFKFEDQQKKEFLIQLKEGCYTLAHRELNQYPYWTRLEHKQCPHCPLKVQKHTHCPIAKKMTHLIDFFRELPSYQEVDVRIETADRVYSKHTSIQSGVSSLIGVYMVTSGCPVMDKLRPMVHFHLPFANINETTYRVISMYLVKQFLNYKRGEKADWDLEGLAKIYEDVGTVNKFFVERIRNICTNDANLNAVIILDTFANYVKFIVDEDVLNKLEMLYID